MTDEEMDALAAADEAKPRVLTDAEMDALEQKHAAPADARTFLQRAKDTVVGGARAVYGVGKDVVNHPVDTITNPAKRREFERGLDDMITLGYGQRLAGRLGRALGDAGDVDLQATEGADAAAAPGYRTTGGLIGALSPGAASSISKLATKALVAPIARAVAPVGAAALGRLASVPYAGAALAPAAAAAGGAARNLLGYEATAPLTAALSAGAEGHREEAAHVAATDPAGLLLSSGLGAAPIPARAAASAVGKAAERYVAKATRAADDWLIKDVVGEQKGASTPTARKQLARDGEDVRAELKKDVPLREAIGAARHGDKAKIEAARTVVANRLGTVGAPRGELYGQVDAALPGGGVRAGDVVKQLDDAIAARTRTGKGYDAAEARELGRIRDRIMGAEDWGAKETVHVEDAGLADDLDALRKVRGNVKSLATGKVIDDQIAAIEATGAKQRTFNPDAIVPSVRLRDLVSDAQRTAFEGEGGLNGTERYQRASAVAGEVKGILDGHLAEAKRTVPEAVKAIEEHNTTTSALLNIDKVLSQRLNKATQDATGASTPAHIAHGIGALAKQAGTVPTVAYLAATGHPVAAATVGAVAAAPTVKRFIDTRVARIEPGRMSAATARAALGGSKAADVGQRVVNAASAGAAANSVRRRALGAP